MSDDDSSSGGDFASKRRSARSNRSKINYAGFGDSRRRDDDDDDDDRPGRRKRKNKEVESSDEEGERPVENVEPQMDIDTLVARRNSETGDPDAYEGPFDYLVKWKELSYLHVSWLSEADVIYLGGTKMKIRIKKFGQAWLLRKSQQEAQQNAEKELVEDDGGASKIDHWISSGNMFDPSLAEVERILSVKTVVEAIAPPPAPLPHDPTEELNGTAAGDQSTAPSPAPSPEPGKVVAPPLKETDIVPNTNLTLGELRRWHEAYEYPPYRQAIVVRDTKRLLKQPFEIQKSLDEENTRFSQQVGALQNELESSNIQLQSSYEESTVQFHQDNCDRLEGELDLARREHDLRVEQLETELVNIRNAGWDKPVLHLAPRECYLVKWKGCTYTNLTWEWAETVNDDLKIALFKRIETPPSGVQMNRAQQAAAAMLKRQKKAKHQASRDQEEDDSASTKRSELDVLRFKRAAETLTPLKVPEALAPYALQLEISGLAQKEDEIICVNGIRCTGLRTEEINKMIKENTMQVRVLRFLRRETGHELEIKFDIQKRMGFVMDELQQNVQPSQQFSWAQKMASNKRKSSTVEYSARIKKFPTPDDFTRGSNPAPIDYVNPAVRCAVLAVFSAREAVSPLTLDKMSFECGVPKEYIHKWLLKDVPRDEQLVNSEQTFQLWVARCAQAFGCSPSAGIESIEASLIADNPQNIILPEARENEDFADVARLHARNLLSTAQNELLGTESRFETEARRQELDFLSAPSISEEQKLRQQELIREQQQQDELDDEDDLGGADWDQGGNGTTVHNQQIRRIQQLQSGGHSFVPYGQGGDMPRFKNNNTLREYQLQGVNWLITKWYEGKNCILADEMGLGKTVQVVAFLEHLRAREQLRGPFLIVAPLSTMGHWRREFENWTDANVCFYYDTSPGGKGRELIRYYEWFYEKLGFRRDVCKFNVLITTYETYIADVDELSKLPFLSVVVDEGHRLKNQGGKLLSELRKVKVKHRLLLSGTPLQNNLTELWSLLNFCEPDNFPSAEAFLRRHGNLQTVEDVMRLQQDIAPYMLRRVKEDVEKSIPPKEETIIDIELTSMQKKYYRAIFERNREFLYKGCKSNNKPQLINVEIELRKCCNHPFLISGAREKEMDEVHQQFEFDTSSLPLREKQRKWTHAQLDRLVSTSGKLVFLDKLLAKLRSEGRKVLIFSQMVKMLDILHEYLEYKGYQHERLDGSVQGNTRQAAIDRFSKSDSKSFVFLLSTKAGGVGINLTAADTAIIFDSDWNPQNDAQAQARCHRIGQDKPVTIYRLVTKNTYEETMLDRAARKLGLEQAVLGAGTTGHSGKELQPEELERMLRLGAYHHLQPSAKDEEETANFMSLDIETLLRTRTRKIKVDGIRGTVSLELTHNTLTVEKPPPPPKPVSSSSNDDTGANVDLNDPDFWNKMLPKEETAQSLLFKLGEQDSLAELKQKAEARFKFVKRVREIVEDILRLRAQGEVIEYSRMDETVALLVQMSALQNVFGKDTAEACRKWTAALEASKERKSRVKAREMKDSMQFEDEKPSTTKSKKLPPQSSSSSSGAAVAEKRGRKKHSDDDEEKGQQEEEEDAPQFDDYGEEDEEGDDHPGDDLAKGEEGGGTHHKALKVSKYASCGFQACHGCYDSTGLDLFPCSGKCQRAFHPSCYKAGLTVFNKCDECQAGGRCTLCDMIGVEAGPGQFNHDTALVKKCFRPDCGRFYHRQCLKKIGKLVSVGAKGEPDDFVCPVHKCFKCGRGDGHASGQVAVHCIRCFKSFHLGCMTPLYTKRASKNLIVCPDHLKGRTFPITDHTKYGELPKKSKPLARKDPGISGGSAAKKPKVRDDGSPTEKRKYTKKPDGGAAGAPFSSSKASNVNGGEKIPNVKIVLKLKPSTTNGAT